MLCLSVCLLRLETEEQNHRKVVLSIWWLRSKVHVIMTDRILEQLVGILSPSVAIYRELT